MSIPVVTHSIKAVMEVEACGDSGRACSKQQEPQQSQHWWTLIAAARLVVTTGVSPRRAAFD